MNENAAVSGRLLLDLGDVMSVTYGLLTELERIGFGHIPPSRIRIEKTDHPYWQDDGTIVIASDCQEPRCIAHEMGHGWHLWLRQKLGYRDIWGEECAETIRYFVEERMGNRNWNPQDCWLRVLNACEWKWDRFQQMLTDHTLFSSLGWGRTS